MAAPKKTPNKKKTAGLAPKDPAGNGEESEERQGGVFDPLEYCEGQPDPLDPEVQVAEIIAQTDTFVIYLDPTHRITIQLAPILDLKELHPILIRGEIIQSLPIGYCRDEHIRASRILVAQAMHAALRGDIQIAGATLDRAEEYIAARKGETARKWFIEASTTGILVLGALAIWISITDLLPESWKEMIGLGFFGSMGAYLSTLERLAGFPWDCSAGRLLHTYESLARLLIGSLGAVVVAMAAKAGIVLSTSEASGESGYWLIAISCIAAGVSERLVPSFVRRIETEALKSEASD